MKKLSFLWNLLLVLFLFTVCRVEFILENAAAFPDFDLAKAFRLGVAGLRFDASAIVWTNLPYLILALLPLRARANRIYATVQKVLYVVLNFLALAMNLADSAYFPYTGRRTTCSFFSEFSNGEDFSGILLPELVNHWYLFVLGFAMLAALILLYRPTDAEGSGWKYYLVHSLIFLAALYPLLLAARGAAGITRPIGLNDANRYVDTPAESAIVLNTPFSIYRTVNRVPFANPGYYPDADAVAQHYSPIHRPSSVQLFRDKNVCILILESFSASYSAWLTGLQGTPHPGYMPFLDSLMQQSLVFRYSFANGRKSIESVPAVLSGIPSLIEPYFTTSYATNDVSGITAELVRNKGYHSSFFHGAPPGSMGFEAYAHITGCQKLYNKDDFGDDSQYDGTWAIFDEPFLQFFKDRLDREPQPFVTTVFTATSHHPFKVPAEYEHVLSGGTLPMHKCIQYTDQALRKFFEAAREEPWFANTVFVLTGDHTNVTDLPEYSTSYGVFEIPIIFYSPEGDLRGLREGIAQQSDITPTLLGYLGYDRPFLSYGCKLLETPDEETWAINCNNGIYQYFYGDRCLQFDGEHIVGLYDYRRDRLQEHNLIGEDPHAEEKLPVLKALIQDYMLRMVENRLTPDKD
ncbi:MAG: sulfatase-like hydrolase/transferase [Bacteroidales bacterium]|nr:sulfatase-like hydrolase/transferase [Bacteroidales bacterium]